jgi:hypothetical protein
MLFYSLLCKIATISFKQNSIVKLCFERHLIATTTRSIQYTLERGNRLSGTSIATHRPSIATQHNTQYTVYFRTWKSVVRNHVVQPKKNTNFDPLSHYNFWPTEHSSYGQLQFAFPGTLVVPYFRWYSLDSTSRSTASCQPRKSILSLQNSWPSETKFFNIWMSECLNFNVWI